MSRLDVLKGVKILGLLIILAFPTRSIALNYFKSSDPFGKRADTIEVNLDNIPEPRPSKTKKSYVTGDRFGFDILETESNWVIDSLLEGIKPDMVVLDVGSGYGGVARAALNKEAIVICNDISSSQLLYNLKHVSAEQKSRLYLNNKDIRRLSLKPKSLDAIIFNRVLEFFNGKEISYILKKAKDWLKEDGRIYIIIISKDHEAFRNKIIYDRTKKWPGEDAVIVKRHLPRHAYALPRRLHVMTAEDLNRILEEKGFLVEKLGDVSLQQLDPEASQDGREAVGAIAIKK